MLRTFPVFHASQVDGVPALAPPAATKTVPERVKDVKLVVLRWTALPVLLGGEHAFYTPTFDVIQMPPDEAFHGPEQRAVVILHELAHASGHPTRLNRDVSGGFGSVLYAKEELRAELTSVAVGSLIRIALRHSQSRELPPVLDRSARPDDSREIFSTSGRSPKDGGLHPRLPHPNPAETRRESFQTLRTRARHRLPRCSQLETERAMLAKSCAFDDNSGRL